VVNDWENYAIEEAVLLKEKFEGAVTTLTIGVVDDLFKVIPALKEKISESCE